MKQTWNYDGDIDLKCGGLFWKEDGADDYVLAVEVTPCSDAGGPDNLFVITEGSISLPTDPEKVKSALATIGQTPEHATRRDLVAAFKAYHGIEAGGHYSGGYAVRIGPPFWSGQGWNPKPDRVLRANAKLANYVKREFLS